MQRKKRSSSTKKTLKEKTTVKTIKTFERFVQTNSKNPLPKKATGKRKPKNKSHVITKQPEKKRGLILWVLKFIFHLMKIATLFYTFFEFFGSTK